MLKVSLIKLPFENWIYVSSFQKTNFYNLPFYGDQILIAWQRIYFINYDIVFRFKNSSIVDKCINQIQVL